MYLEQGEGDPMQRKNDLVTVFDTLKDEVPHTHGRLHREDIHKERYEAWYQVVVNGELHAI